MDSNRQLMKAGVKEWISEQRNGIAGEISLKPICNNLPRALVIHFPLRQTEGDLAVTSATLDRVGLSGTGPLLPHSSKLC